MAALLVVLGCTPTEPRPVEAEFVAQSVGGESLPALVVSGEFATITLLADTIRIYRDGTGFRVTVVHAVTDYVEIPETGPVKRYENTFSYRYVDGVFELEYPCPDVASCVAPPHFTGTFSGDQLFGSDVAWHDKQVQYRVVGTAPTSY
ncbi:MAG: hypothetical protein WD801_14615 [Gemmatimonadaceae bacterium]